MLFATTFKPHSNLCRSHLPATPASEHALPTRPPHSNHNQQPMAQLLVCTHISSSRKQNPDIKHALVGTEPRNLVSKVRQPQLTSHMRSIYAKPKEHAYKQHGLNPKSAQYQLTRDTIRDMCHIMKHSYATTSQKMRTLNTCIRTKIRYAFCVAPYTKAQLKALDSPLCRAAKEAYGLPNSTATAVAHEEEGGSYPHWGSGGFG